MDVEDVDLWGLERGIVSVCFLGFRFLLVWSWATKNDEPPEMSYVVEILESRELCLQTFHPSLTPIGNSKIHAKTHLLDSQLLNRRLGRADDVLLGSPSLLPATHPLSIDDELVAGLQLAQGLLRLAVQLGRVERVATVGEQDLKRLLVVGCLVPGLAVADGGGAEDDFDPFRHVGED